MRFINLKKMTMTIAFALVAVFATSEFANGQNIYKERQKQQKRIEKSQRKYEQQQQKRYYEQQQQQRYNAQRYRVYNNGRYYNTDQRGTQILQQAVNKGYQQGYRAGRNDSSGRNRYGYNNQSMYRNGNYGWSYVDQSQYRYYFQQGFQRGYQDGYYSRNQYGNNNGSNILSSILSTILNIQQY